MSCSKYEIEDVTVETEVIAHTLRRREEKGRPDKGFVSQEIGIVNIWENRDILELFMILVI